MAKPPDGQSCATCRYYCEEDQVQGGVPYPGHCCCHPPVLHPSVSLCIYPPVRNNAWCGEYAPANPETIEEGAALMCRLYLLGDKSAAYALADKLKAREA